ncbi:AMP-binding protein [Nocardia mexicana]|uniref:Acyl-CoA synthetase (AMP-forming)/AMP-acid ligase II n=1 Tax=Nocardia mexicana TaxID=279262 RepID=A0A370HC42_9NOCA|nr:AMP-binding protein [Nocardia mexicana]RDI54350.1 acyl-CoA synthetase (AMP-forming)/AMP-acid ligase II [Nocardia mexicana]
MQGDDDIARVRGWLVDPADGTGIHLADEADGWEFRSYRELADLAWAVAAQLRGAGLVGGAGACVIMPTGFPCVAAFYAVWACGGVFTPVAPPTFGDLAQYISHVAEILRQARPHVVVTSADLEALVRRAMSEAGRADEPVLIGEPAPVAEREFGAPGECALLQFTSGSTGTPRGVRVSWRNLANNVAMITRLVDWRAGEAMASWLPLYHDMGLVGAFFTTVTNQGDLYLMRPDQFIRDPVRWLRAMTHAQHSPSPSFALGYVAHRVSPEQIAELDLSGWRALAVGSEPVEVADLASFTELAGPQGFSARAFTLAYGLAEATLMVTSSARNRPLTALRLDTASLRFGRPIQVVDEAFLDDGRWVTGPGWITGLGYSTAESIVRVVGEDGRELPDGTLGEMVVTGDSVALGYTGTAGGGTRIEDGRLSTGDAGFRYRGEVFVLGRMGSSLKVRGRSVFMEDIESRVARETGITKGKLAAVALTETGAQGVALFAETAPGPWIAQARSIVRGALGPAQTATIVTGPRGFIRRTSSGKPRRRHMWQLFRDGGLDGAEVHEDAGDRTGPPGPMRGGAQQSPVLSVEAAQELLDRALNQVAVAENSAMLLEGSLAEGFGNAGSDVDFLVVTCGVEELPTLPTVLFIDGRRVEVRTRSAGQLRAQLERVARAERPAALDEDVLNRCQRFLHGTALRGGPEGADITELRSLLPPDEFARILGDWWAERARQALRYAVALHAMGEQEEADAWARDGLLQAVKAWAARRGETYVETKWLPEQLDRIADPVASARMTGADAHPQPMSGNTSECTVAGPNSELITRYRALGRSASLSEILALAAEFGVVDVADDPEQVVLARVPGVTTWGIGERVHVIRGDSDVFVLSERGGRAWRSVVLRRSVAEVLERTDIGAELAEFVRLGLVGLQWRGGGSITPALAMCKPLRPYTPVPGRSVPALGLAGAAREAGPEDAEPIATLSPLPASRFTACALDLVWSNVVLENAREDLVGAVKGGQGAVADIAAHRLVAMCVRMLLSAYGIQPLPADVAPARTLARLLPDAAGGRAELPGAVEAAGRVCFSQTLAAGDDPLAELARLDDLVARVRAHVGGNDFPASFDSREQWRRTLDISYDWLRVAGYLDTDLPLDEARDLLTSGGRQPHLREGGPR